MTRKSLRTKRIFSIILSLAVALTMMPMSALAADESSSVGNAVAEGAEGRAAQIGDTVYSTLPDAGETPHKTAIPSSCWQTMRLRKVLVRRKRVVSLSQKV